MTDFDSHIARHVAPFPVRKLLSLMFTVASGSVPICAMAQGAEAVVPAASAPRAASAASAAADDTIQLNQVVITASRRREPAREVPMQVDTLSAEKLQASGASTLTDYLAEEPGIDVKTTGGTGNGAIAIRGVTTGDQTIATVSLYVDDVAIGSSSAFANGAASALDMALLDLNHIEVLRGPQGTLYGAGAMGGLLKYVTNEPDTSELSGQVSQGASFTRGGAASFTTSGIINVPLKEDVAGLRVSAFHERVGGFVDATGAAAGRDVDSGDNQGGRVSLLVEPSSRWKVRLTATGQEIRRDGSDYVDYDIATGQPLAGHATHDIQLAEPYSMRMGVATADIEYDFGWARLNSISSAQASRSITRLDYSSIFGPVFDVPTASFDTSYFVHKQTQEFRLTSKGGTPLEWIAGLYDDHETGQNYQYLSAETNGDLLHAILPSNYRERAAYGDLTWNATSRFALTAGMRVARNVQSFTQTGGGELLGGGPDTVSPGGSAETSRTYLATGKYALTPTSNVYVRIASGYRPGGPNFAIADAPPTFKHDTLWSYEAGYKADLLNKSLSVQAALYDIHWSQIQQATTNSEGLGYNTNGGKAQIQGVELSTTWRPLSALTLVGGLAYNDARLTQDAPGLAASGAPLPDNPRFSANLAANYTFELAGRAAYAGIGEHWVGNRDAGFTGNTTYPQYRLPRYSMTDLQAGVDLQHVSLAFFVRNLFDKHAQISAETSLVPLGGPNLVTEARPLTVGTTLTAKF
jgi:outer membrane receptor protein involved in Fe transport